MNHTLEGQLETAATMLEALNVRFRANTEDRARLDHERTTLQGEHQELMKLAIGLLREASRR